MSTGTNFTVLLPTYYPPLPTALRLMPTASSRTDLAIRAPDFVNTVALSNDGHRAVSGSDDKTIKVWDLAQGTCERSLEGHAFYVNCVVLSPDGRHIMSGSSDHTAKLWDIESGEALRTYTGDERAAGLTQEPLPRALCAVRRV